MLSLCRRRPVLFLYLKLAKLLAVSVLFAGTIGTFLPRDFAERRRFAYLLAGPGFGATWIVGFALLVERTASFLSTWVLGGMALSFFSLNVVLWSAGREGRRSAIAATLALGSLVATAALMIWRP